MTSAIGGLARLRGERQAFPAVRGGHSPRRMALYDKI